MSILRKTQRVTFTTIENELLNDDRLSFRARGIAAFLMSKPDGWNIKQEYVVKQGTEGRDAIRTAMQELVECGYAKICKVQDELGHWRTETRLSDSPVFAEDTELLETRSPVEQEVGEPGPLVKTDVVNTEKNNMVDPMTRMPKQRKEHTSAVGYIQQAKEIGLNPKQFVEIVKQVLEESALTLLVDHSDSADATWKHNDAKEAAIFLGRMGYAHPTDIHELAMQCREWLSWRGDSTPSPADLKTFVSKGKPGAEEKRKPVKIEVAEGDYDESY